MTLAEQFCRCIKHVRRSIRVRNKKQSKESAAIAVCVRSVLHTRGKTLTRFRCKKPKLRTHRH